MIYKIFFLFIFILLLHKKNIIKSEPNLSNESAVSGAIATQGVRQISSLYQIQTLLHRMNQQAVQQIQPIYTSNVNTNKADILLQNNIPSCSNQDGGLRGDGFSWYSDEDISENEQQETENKSEWQTVSHKRERIGRQKSTETAEQIDRANRHESLSHMHCYDITGNASETDTVNRGEEGPKPPPIYIYI
jgi:hypothetical protein